MKRLTFVMIFLVLVFGGTGLVFADEDMGVFVNLNTNSIQFIDPVTNTATEPLLVDELRRTGSGLLDVVITHDGKTAIVSNFGGARVFFIDISAGFNAPPTLLGSARTAIFAEDMVITPDDKYVLVTDGAFSSNIAVVDIPNRQFIHNNNLGWRDAQAIDITPDGETVVVVDYFGGWIHAYTLRSDGILLHKKSISVLPFWPINITISPDGRTAIATDAFSSHCLVFFFDSAGELHYQGVSSLPAQSGQSCVFSKDGSKAYYLSNSQSKGTMVHILNVTGVGQVSASGTSIKIWPRRGTGQFFGVDTMALDPSENYLYVTNPTSSAPINDVALLDLTTNTQVGYIPGLNFPVGIAFTTIMSENGNDHEQ
jgi:DNA-binding beta-propeller fold protein YncE